MPTAARIHESLSAAANESVLLALAWHIALALAALALLAGWRPSHRTAAALIALPLVSVGIVAWSFHNVFNAAVFLTLGLTLMSIARGLDEEGIRPGPRWAQGPGVAMLAFGWVYPHFVEPGSPARYLYAAPTGVVPCPTLAIVIGAMLLGGAIVAPRWAMALGALAAFYSLFGVFRLGVTIDLVLLVGAAALVLEASVQPGGLTAPRPPPGVLHAGCAARRGPRGR